MREARSQWADHGWGASADGMEIVLELMHAQRSLTERVNRLLRPFDLTFARYEILMLLSFTRRGAMPIGRMGRLLQVHPTSVTSAVDKLERQGLVVRDRPDGDRRVVVVKITSAGRQVASDATEAVNENVFEALGLTPTQLATLWSVLRAFRVSASDFYPPPGRRKKE